MTSISLRSYVSTALDKPTGEIRIAKGTQDQLVNKGTLGNRIASFFQDAARAIGLMRPDPTQAQRQQGALDGFRQALQGRFGAEAANAGLQHAGLDLHGARLDGRAVIAAAQHAKTVVAQNRTANLAALREHLPPGPGEEASEAFQRTADRMKPQLDPSTLSASQRLEYTTRLRDAVLAESRLNRTALDGDTMAELSKATLKQVLTLSAADGLETAKGAREAYTAALKDVLKGMASGKDATVLTQRLSEAVARFQEHATAERLQEVGGGEFQELTELALRHAMVELRTENPSLLAKAQKNALKEDSPLRALSAAAQDVVRTEGFNAGAGPAARREAAGRLFSMTNAIVGGLANALGATTGSTSRDLDRLNDDATVPRRALDRATQSLQTMLATVPIPPTPGETLLAGIKDRFGAVDEDGFPGWHSPALLREVESHVQEQMEMGKAREGAIDDLRETLAGDTSLHPGLRAKLEAALDAMAEEANLHGELQKHPAFEGLSQDDAWRLFAVGRQQAEGLTKWDLEHHGEGSLAGMQRAFQTMLKGLSEGQPLTAEHLEAIHVEGSRGAFRGDDLMLSYKDQISDDTEMQAMFRENAQVPQGYREDGTNLNLRKGPETTEAGRAELAELARKDGWFAGIDEREEAFEITLTPCSGEECRERTNAILATYREEIGNAKTDDDKGLVIAKATQDLYRSHVFMDGNTRSVVFTAMNRMLLENGLPPAILPDPKAAAGFSRAEFAAEILKGQLAFAKLTGG